MESEHLDAAREIDQMYHGAKLQAAAFNEPERIWQEHEQVRSAMLPRPEEAASQLPPMEVIARMHRKLRDSGILKPRSEERH